MGDVFTYRFEVLLPERGWVPYTAEALGTAEDDVYNGGDRLQAELDDEWRREALEGVERLRADPAALADYQRQAHEWAELDIEVYDDPYAQYPPEQP